MSSSQHRASEPGATVFNMSTTARHESANKEQQPIELPLASSSKMGGGNVLTTIFYGALIVFLLVKYRRQRKEATDRKLKSILKQNNLKILPTPPQMPVIGHLHLMRDYPHNPWDGFKAIREQYGDIVSLKMGVHSMVLVSAFELMNEVLIKKGHIFADRPYFPRHNIVFGGDKENSLALCNWSSTHRDRRKFCKRGVVPNKLSARNQLLEKIISDILKRFVENISASRVSQLDNQEPIRSVSVQHNDDDDVVNNRSTGNWSRLTKNDLLFLTGDIFMKFLCNEQCSHDDKSYEKFNISCDFIFYDINQCYLLDFMPYLTSFGFGYSYLKQLKEITDYCRYYIDDNIFEPRRLKHVQSSSNKRDSCHSDDSLDYDFMMIEGKQPPSEHDNIGREDDYLDSIIKEQISGATTMTLEDYKVGFADLLAGHAAVTNILMRLLGHLSLDQEIQDMIHDEAERANLSVLDQAPPLPVAEAALQEALRLASSPIVPHVAREDTSISGYYVPKGSAVLFNCYSVNLSPDLWVKPRDYNPRRFLDSSKNDQGEVSYKLNLPKYFTPFSIGQRQCLGYKMVESISIFAVARICQAFRIKANDEQLVRRLLEPKGTVALSPLDECFEFKLYPR
jgi:cytochrome P450 family 307 subfamily A